jgi:hypothetical protein
MKIKLLFTSLFALVLLSVAAFADVKITPKKTTYKRPKPQMDFKKKFTVTRPLVKAATPALSRKIEAALSYEKNFQFTIREEMTEMQWLEDASYNVLYNMGDILSVSLFIEGSGAYPSSSTKWVVVDSRTGVKQTPAMVFTNLAGLAAMIAKDQKAEIAEGIKEIKKDPDFEDPDPSTLFTDAKFTTADLKDFSVDAKGVTFHYNYSLPHVIQALQPAGEFSYTWEQIKPYIKRGGLLSRAAR